jgi:hypothetical protein
MRVGYLRTKSRRSSGPRATKVELYFNMKTAKVLGLTMPQIMPMTADEVIE